MSERNPSLYFPASDTQTLNTTKRYEESLSTSPHKSDGISSFLLKLKFYDPEMDSINYLMSHAGHLCCGDCEVTSNT